MRRGAGLWRLAALKQGGCKKNRKPFPDWAFIFSETGRYNKGDFRKPRDGLRQHKNTARKSL
jgi:hypothetical protein